MFVSNSTTHDGYPIAKSLRFRASNSSAMGRTFGVATSTNVFTYALWVKRGSLGTEQYLLSGGNNSTIASQILFQADNTINFYNYSIF